VAKLGINDDGKLGIANPKEQLEQEVQELFNRYENQDSRAWREVRRRLLEVSVALMEVET
jgi:hypothetical protein